jgi:hypothetical protein
MRDNIMRMWTAKFKMSVATVCPMVLLGLLCSLTIPGPVQAAVFFDASFETCAVGTGNDFPCEGWNDFGKEFINQPNHNKIEITNSLAFSGTKSVKATFVNALGGIDNPSIYRYFPLSDHIFARFVTIQSPAFQICAVNSSTKMVRLTASAGGFYPVVSIGMVSNRYAVGVEGSWSLGSFLIQGGPVPSSTSWDQVELEIKLNTPGVADGLIRAWVNGVLWAERLNLQLRGPTPTSINSQGILNSSNFKYDTFQWFVQCGLGTKHMDRMAVGNTRIGLATGQTSSDTTPPAIPSGIR